MSPEALSPPGGQESVRGKRFPWTRIAAASGFAFVSLGFALNGLREFIGSTTVHSWEGGRATNAIGALEAVVYAGMAVLVALCAIGCASRPTRRSATILAGGLAAFPLGVLALEFLSSQDPSTHGEFFALAFWIGMALFGAMNGGSLLILRRGPASRVGPWLIRLPALVSGIVVVMVSALEPMTSPPGADGVTRLMNNLSTAASWTVALGLLAAGVFFRWSTTATNGAIAPQTASLPTFQRYVSR